MISRFCQRCYNKMLANLRKSTGGDPTISIDKNGCNFACKIPLYESDEQGRPIVKIWDCKKEQLMIYTQMEWDRKQRDEEV